MKALLVLLLLAAGLVFRIDPIPDCYPCDPEPAPDLACTGPGPCPV